MFRVFESLDELVQILEEAHGVPLSANCMVPRQRVLELLDELRDAFPTELDDAQDVLDQRDEILNDADARANNTITTADDEARRIVDEAEARANHTIEDANAHAAGTVAAAEDDARRIRDNAQHEYETVVDRASAEADRLVTAGNESYERSVAEGREEQARLVSESTVVREANEESRRLLADAHADSSRLREECDRYVDSKLAEFETTLQETLRNVGRNRSALRSGAGAVGGSSVAGNQNQATGAAEGYERRRYER
ncbi:MAG: DivIVA domain-containing protein [Corynebacterium sp.]|uniref:DivIVA domain-containing protein n=1 Tax=Corynebacterium sp. TaxID=1720 RepID=UPI0026DBB4A1|nr:DivIVA domain-containing protein [Corynebacterium sp.]MDO5029318.1 DivIVA domain-containing protein [Corynebacterium sp.]